jgi:hypothetical protein
MFVWGYALTWFLINDCVKLLAYRIFDSARSGSTSAGKHRSGQRRRKHENEDKILGAECRS